MLALVLNTCAADGSAALAEDLEILAREALPARGTSEALLPALRRLFAATGLKPVALGAVVVVSGPGSFTGVRVGMSAAKGLCDAAACPLVAVSRLALLAEMTGAPEALALLDGGRGEFFTGHYRGSDAQREALLTGAETRELMARVHAAGGVVCTSEPRVLEALGGEETARLLHEPGPEELVRLLVRRAAENRWSDAALADANYLRRTDAELKQAASGDLPARTAAP